MDSSNRNWWALVAIAASVLVVGLDLTVLNLALPTIATDLHASTSDLQWFSDAYSLVLAAAMLPAGLLGGRLGRRERGGLRVRGGGGGADRGPGGTGHRRRGDLPAVAGRDPGAVRARGAAEGDRADGLGYLHQLPDRPDRGRLPARPLLVGLGVPDQRTGGGAGPGGRGVPAARVAQRAAAQPGHPRRDPVQRGADRADLRVHQGRAGRLDERRRAGHHRGGGRGGGGRC